MPSPTVLLFGGLALFLFGMQLAKDHMQRLAGERIRVLIQKLTDNPILGLLLGICMTITVQSSGATAVLLVGLGS
ncbi:MAG TPA: Na/Pi cotransporter family protein, partial [Bdellovibrionota bacterium]|nr:Na/Pi cotransporter family protein [Bdellovibrionota bacterium]